MKGGDGVKKKPQEVPTNAKAAQRVDENECREGGRSVKGFKGKGEGS